MAPGQSALSLGVFQSDVVLPAEFFLGVGLHFSKVASLEMHQRG